MPAVRPVSLTIALVLVLTGCRTAERPDQSAAAAGGAVAPLLATRSAAVLAGDRAALTSTLAADADPATADLGARIAELRLVSWSYDVRSTTPGPGEMSVRAVLSYRLAADPLGDPPATATRLLALIADPARPGGWLLRSDQPVGAWLPWDVGPVAWSGGPDASVLDLRSGSPDDRALVAGATRAAAAVTSVWGTGWRRAPVVVATGGAAQLAQLTGRDPAATVGLVAVTTSDRVYLDAGAWLALSPAGRQVLLSHEVTHLATGAAADPRVPLWLEEGFADYVGFRGSGIPVPRAAAALLGPVAAGAAVPPALPSDRDFAATAAVQGRAYAGAWLVCRLIASTEGVRALVAVYRATSAGRSDPAANVDAALRLVTGEGTATWTARWRASVAALA